MQCSECGTESGAFCCALVYFEGRKHGPEKRGWEDLQESYTWAIGGGDAADKIAALKAIRADCVRLERILGEEL